MLAGGAGAEGCMWFSGLDLKITLGILCYFSFPFTSRMREPSRERGGPGMAGSQEQRSQDPRVRAWGGALCSPPAAAHRGPGEVRCPGGHGSPAAPPTSPTFISLIRKNDALK